MWFKLAGATFTNNLGTMDSISKSYMMDYSGLTGLQASPGSVSYATDSTPDATITFTVKSGYVFKSGSTVTASGGASKTYTASADIVAGSSFTMALTGINNKVIFTGAAELVSGGGGSEGDNNTPSDSTYTLTINVIPSDANLIVYNGTTTSDPVLHQGTGSTALSNIAANTTVRVTVSKSGYNSLAQTVTVTENTTLNVELDAISVPEGTTNIISQGTLYEKKALSSSSYSMTANESYFVYDQIPVEAGATYQVSSGLRTWWLKSDKTKISTINFSSTNYVATAPASAAYVSVTYPYTAVTPDTAWIVKIS